MKTDLQSASLLFLAVETLMGFNHLTLNFRPKQRQPNLMKIINNWVPLLDRIDPSVDTSECLSDVKVTGTSFILKRSVDKAACEDNSSRS